MRIWTKAEMNTHLFRSCIKKLENLWIQWKVLNKQRTGKNDERKEGFSRKVNTLWDSAAEGDVHQIMLNILLGKKEKKEDAEFY